MNLFELIKQNIVKPGGHNINVPIKKANGDKYNGTTYAIPLKYLYYNDQNGRIGVALSEHESEKGKLNPGHNEEYNLAVQKMLAEFDEKSKSDMKVLVRDIATKNQSEPGYVLSDGRVIDGNRRFTAKRILEQDPEVTGEQYFEAVILDDLFLDNVHDKKIIKSLELQIQFGKVEKVDYNPIDRAIDAYKTVSVDMLMTALEYSKYANLTKAEVDKRILVAELVIKFLEFANSNPENYALAKQMELDGPLQDLVPQYKKFKNKPESEQLLNSLFSKIIQIRSSKEDFKSEYRQIVKSVVGTKNEKVFIEEMEDATDAIVEALESGNSIKNNLDLMQKIQSNSNAIEAMAKIRSVSTNHSEKAKNTKQQNEPRKLAEKAVVNIESIDETVMNNLPKGEKEKLTKQLIKLQQRIAELLEKGE